MKHLWVWALAAAACGGTKTETTTVNTTAAPSAHVANDLNADGTADTATFDAGAVTAAGASFTVPADWEATGARVIELGGQAAVVVSSSVVEDDLVWHVLLWQDGTLVDAGSAFVVGEETATFPGDGTFRVETGNCGQSSTLTYRIDGGKVVKDEQTTGTFDESMCAACPYIFVGTGASRVFVGESLRNLVGPAQASEDALVLPAVALGQTEIIVTVAEVKAETTYLDALAVEFDGVRVAPSAGPAAAMAADGAPTVIDLGERRRFAFAVPAGFSGSPVLHARGYYLPR